MFVTEELINELEAYEGVSPCPVDIDEYWDRALAEMRATDPMPEIVPADFKVPGFLCYDLYFNSVRSGRIHCKIVRKENLDGKAPAVLKFHGYSGNSGEWSTLLPFAAVGFVVCAMDVRGQGGYSDDKNPVSGGTLRGQVIRGVVDKDPDNIFYRQIYLDTAMTARVVMDLDFVDKDRVYSYGGSQGGALSLACAALVPEIKKTAAVFPFLCDFKCVNTDVVAYEDIKTYFRYFDPTHERCDEFYYKLGYIDVQNIAKRIKAKVRMYTALKDTVCPPKAQFAMFNKISSEKEFIFYPDYGHEDLQGEKDKTIQFFLED